MHTRLRVGFVQFRLPGKIMEALIDINEIGIDEESLQITITPEAGTLEEAENVKKKIKEISKIKGPAYIRAVITAYEIEK